MSSERSSFGCVGSVSCETYSVRPEVVMIRSGVSGRGLSTTASVLVGAVGVLIVTVALAGCSGNNSSSGGRNGPRASDGAGWPTCDVDVLTTPPWPGVGDLEYLPGPAARPDDLADQIAALVKRLDQRLDAASSGAVITGCRLRDGGDGGADVGLTGSASQGYRLGGVVYPARLESDSIGVQVTGNHSAVNLRSDICGVAKTCNVTLSVRFGDVEGTATVDGAAEVVAVDLDRDPTLAGALTLAVSAADGGLIGYRSIVLPPGDFAAG